MRKPKFKIGDWVTSESFASASEVAGARTYQSAKRATPIVGQVVGAALRAEGKYCPGRGPFNDDGDVESPYLDISRMITVWLVREGMTNKPAEVLETDLRPTEAGASGLPWRKCDQPPFDEAYRKMLSELAKELPRKNGKFAKAEKVVTGAKL